MAYQTSTTSYMADGLLTTENDEYPNELDLEIRELFTSYLDSSLQLSNASDTTQSTSLPTITTASSSSSAYSKNSRTSTVREEYRPRTLGAHNVARLSILPSYPLLSVSTSASQNLLLSNVPIDSLTEEQYARVRYRAFPPSFKLEMDMDTKLNPEKNNQMRSSESFLLSFYRDLYLKLKKRLKIDIPIIDFNLTRLRNCIGKVVTQRGQQQTMLNIDELAIALEFYLQFDVDMFFLKTCSFNGVQPRLFENRFREGLFCIDPPEARFTIEPCGKKYCLCCHSPCPRRYPTDLQQISVIPFSMPHIHRFVNQYEAILNCPATCETNNCIYVLTCPCGQFDFIGRSKLPFAETLMFHRIEGNRIMREFLIGENNVHDITHGLKTEEKRISDEMWLYQHSTHCSVALQLFLDDNPDYWCFVPMKRIELNLLNVDVRRSSPVRTNIHSMSNIAWARSNEQVHLLVANVPKPPLGFDFSIGQRQQQAHFFKFLKDRVVPPDNVDLYNADIVAIVPDHSSELFGQLIESLFVTHAECKLNEIGHLIHENTNPNRALHSLWCANLPRRP